MSSPFPRYAPRHPDNATVLADLDPELDGLPLGVRAASSRNEVGK
jgi:hypothetical protein